LLVRFALPESAEGGQGRVAVRARIVERVRAVPGVVGAGATKNAPLTENPGEAVPFTIPGRPTPPPGEEPRVLLQPATPGFLRALGVPLLAGEDVSADAGDSTVAPGVVVSRRMAEQVWPGRSPLGETFAYRNLTLRVVGVAGDVRSARLDSIAGFTAYLPDRVMPRSSMALVVRTAGDPAALVGPVRAAVRQEVPGQPILEIAPLGAKLHAAAATPRLFTALVAAFGTVALLLAAVGLYGVVAYVVRQREREIGVRLALGAPPSRVLTLMLGQGMRPVAAGLALGLLGALAGGRVLRALLYGVSATDPLTFVAVAVVFTGVALLAAYLPSRHAARVHPSITLRGD
jgi:predicted permease